jgi:hypothetical protein
MFGTTEAMIPDIPDDKGGAEWAECNPPSLALRYLKASLGRAGPFFLFA